MINVIKNISKINEIKKLSLKEKFTTEEIFVKNSKNQYVKCWIIH